MKEKNNKHESKKLNDLIGKQVEITFFDNDIATGVLEKKDFGFGYRLVTGLNENNWVFPKSHVKHIKELK